MKLNYLNEFFSLYVEDYEIPKDVFSLPKSLRPVLDSLGIDFGSLQSLQTLGLFLPRRLLISQWFCLHF